jgi:hypothetical protein
LWEKRPHLAKRQITSRANFQSGGGGSQHIVVCGRVRVVEKPAASDVF